MNSLKIHHLHIDVCDPICFLSISRLFLGKPFADDPQCPCLERREGQKRWNVEESEDHEVETKKGTRRVYIECR